MGLRELLAMHVPGRCKPWPVQEEIETHCRQEQASDNGARSAIILEAERLRFGALDHDDYTEHDPGQTEQRQQPEKRTHVLPREVSVRARREFLALAPRS